MKRLLSGLLLVLLLAGCASNHHAETRASGASDGVTNRADRASSDAKIVRGLLDSMASPASNYPANLPR